MTACSLGVKCHSVNRREVIPDRSHKLAVAQLVEKLRDVYGSQRSAAVCVRSRRLTAPGAM
jgi:hypothetical protein